MTRFISAAFASLLTTTFLVGTAHAKPKADTNQDGTVTRAEFNAASQARFANTDLNADGYLSTDELENARAARKSEKQARSFERLDVNGDGVITQDEYSTSINNRRAEKKERRAERRDINKDGTVDDQDRELWKEKRAEMRKNRSDRRAKKRSGGERGNHWKKIDTNGDGLVSAQEYSAGADRMFERFDANGDGVLSKGEGRKKRRKKRRRSGR